MRFRLPEDVAETNLLGRRGHTRAQCGNCKFFFSGNLQIVPLSWRKEPGISGTCWWSTFEITLLRESEHVALRIKRWQLALDKAADGRPLLSAAYTGPSRAWPGHGLAPTYLHTLGPALLPEPSQLSLERVWPLFVKHLLRFTISPCHDLSITSKVGMCLSFHWRGKSSCITCVPDIPCSLVRYRKKNSKIRQASVTLGPITCWVSWAHSLTLQHLPLRRGANCTCLRGLLGKLNEEVKEYFSRSLLDVQDSEGTQ